MVLLRHNLWACCPNQTGARQPCCYVETSIGCRRMQFPRLAAKRGGEGQGGGLLNRSPPHPALSPKSIGGEGDHIAHHFIFETFAQSNGFVRVFRPGPWRIGDIAIALRGNVRVRLVSIVARQILPVSGGNLVEEVKDPM